MKTPRIIQAFLSPWTRSTPFSSDPGPGFLNWRDILGKKGIRKTELSDPFSQHPYAAGAIRLAGTMLGAVPFRIVEEDRAATTRMREALDSGDSARLLAVKEFEVLAKRERPRACFRYSQGIPVKAVDGSPWVRLFEEGTANVARSELWSATLMGMLGSKTGQSFLIFRGGVDGYIDEKTMPTEVAVWPADLVRRPKDKAGWEINTAGGWKFYPEWQVCEFRSYSPDTGKNDSPLRSAWSNMQSDLAAQDWNSEFFLNGAEVGNILSTDQKITQDQADEMGKRWDGRHKQRGKTAVMGSGVSLTATTATQNEMDFVEQFRLNREAVLATLLVHKAALGVTDQLNRATIEAARQMMWSNLLLPTAAYYEDRLYAHLFSRFDNGTRWGIFDVSGVPELADDVQTKGEALATLTEAGIPMNDAVRLTGLDLPLYAWGDVPMGQLGPAGGDKPDEKPRAAEPEAPKRDDAPKVNRFQERRAEQERNAHKWWESVGSDVERSFQKKVRAWMLDIRKDVLNKVEAKRGSRAITDTEIDALLFDLDRFTKALSGETQSLYEQTIETSMEGIRGELGALGMPSGEQVFNLTDKAVTTFLQQKESRLRGVAREVKREIRKGIARMVAQNATVKEIADEVRRISNYQLAPGRTMTIARTETGNASNNVRRIGMEAAGVQYMSWVAAPDARAEHKAINDLTVSAAADGTPYEMGTDFAPLVGAPGTLRYPHDPQGDASMVINCRCVMVPEIIEEEDELLKILA